MKKVIAASVLTLGLLFGSAGVANAELPTSYSGSDRSRVVQLYGYTGPDAVCTLAYSDIQRDHRFEKYRDRRTGKIERRYASHKTTYEVYNCVAP